MDWERNGGGLVTYLGANVSCSISFHLVHLIGGNALRALDNRVARYLFSHLDRHPVRSMTLLRLVFQTVPALNYALALALALSRVRFRDYLTATLIGLPIPIMLYCIFFDLLFHFLPIGNH